MVPLQESLLIMKLLNPLKRFQVKRKAKFDAAVNRAANQTLARFWNAAKTSGLTMDWIMANTKIDDEIKQSIVRMRGLARDLYQNNSYARKAIREIGLNVAGPSGFKLQMKVYKAGDEIDKKTNDKIEEAWAEYCKKQYFTIRGKESGATAQRNWAEQLPRDGEIILRILRGRQFNKFGFTLQQIEADYLDERYNARLENGNRVIMGVEYDAWDRRAGYHFKMENGTRVRYGADEIIHVYINERSDQSRGMTALAPAMLLMQMAAGYEEAGLVKVRSAATNLGFLYKTVEGEQQLTTPPKNDGENEVPFQIDMAAGTLQSLPIGWRHEAYDPKFPESTHGPFLQNVVRQIASALGISYPILANNVEDVNYSSARVAIMDEREEYKAMQYFFIENILEEIFPLWLEAAIANGALELDYNKLPIYEKAARWIGRRWNWVDPEKDIRAKILAIEAGLESRTNALLEVGRDIEDVFEELSQEEELRKQYGLTFKGLSNGNSNAGQSGETGADAQTDAGDNAVSGSGNKNGRSRGWPHKIVNVQ
jgi:lambda family phage portal protein